MGGLGRPTIQYFLRSQRQHNDIAYGRRASVLEDMGYRSYADYLKSGLWGRIRAQVLAENPACYVCGAPASQVHHKVYSLEVLEGLNLAGLYSVCGPCHEWAEYDDKDGVKLSPIQATNRLRAARVRRIIRGG